MTNNPLVSVIIPCYNAERWLAEAIDSVLAQTYRPLELIIIDDGSTDGSLAIIKRYAQQHPDLIRYETGPNRGAPAARNRGLELAQGEFVKFLDADDILLPDCVERQIVQAEKLPPGKKAIVYGDACRTDEEGNPLPAPQKKLMALAKGWIKSKIGWRSRFLQQLYADPIAYMIAYNPLTTCPLHRKEYLQEIGGFDPELTRGQEQDLHLRLRLAGVEFVYFPVLVFLYRQHRSPHRISESGRWRKGPMNPYHILMKRERLIETATGRTLSPTVRRVLALRYQAFGELLRQQGLFEESTVYFTRAKELDPVTHVAGTYAYRFLVRLLGAKRAEAIITWRDKLPHLLKQSA